MRLMANLNTRHAYKDNIRRASMIRNKTRKTILSRDVRVFLSSWKQALGLMFRLQSPKWGALFAFKQPRRVSIHMFFVFFPLDILWIDESGEVVDMKTLKPWSLYAPRGVCSYVIELPCGTILKTRTQIGDIISIDGFVNKASSKAI